MSRRYRAAVYGASGYAGAELIRRLLRHPAFELVQVCSADHLGEPIARVHLNLEGCSDLRFEPVPAAPDPDLDVVLLGLPHDVSHRVVGGLRRTSTRVIDLSGAFRVKDAESYRSFYGQTHPLPELLSEFVYGLPELNRDRIRTARFIASPGCFATCIQLGLLPLARSGLLAGGVDTVGITGSSGSGAAPSLGTHHPIRSVNLRTYRPLMHQHAPEVIESLITAGARDLSLHFVPVSAPLSRGIFVSSFVRLPASINESELKASYTASYREEPFVRLPEDRLPEVVAVHGSCYAEVGVVLGPLEGERRLVTCFSALDNLIKGGAGQAIQNLNLMFGVNERVGLDDPGGFP